MTTNTLTRCTRCVMPETWAGITFNEQGVCSLCQAYEDEQKTDWATRQGQLVDILAHYKSLAIRKGKKYHCICGYSGGKDTAFTIAILVKEFGITPLAFTYNHGHPLLPEGKWNLDEFPKSLGIDHLQFTMGNKLRNALCKKGCELIGDFCLPCHRGVGAGIVHIAKALGIELAIFGEPTALYSTTGTYKIADQEENDQKHFNDVFCGNLGDITPPGFDESSTWILNWPKGRLKLRSIYLGNYLPWNQLEHVEYIKKLGWKCPPATLSNPWPWNKLDCDWERHRNWQKIVKGLGFDSVAFRASIDIREGQTTREQALDLIRRIESTRPNDMDEFLADIKMTEKDFNQLSVSSIRER